MLPLDMPVSLWKHCAVSSSTASRLDGRPNGDAMLEP